MSLKRHTTYNLLGALLPVGISLLTVPAYLHFIGEERFGMLGVAWLLLGYFGLFDLGLGLATSHHVAAAGEADPQERTRVFWSALWTNLGLGALGGLLLWPAAWYYFAYVLSVAPAMRQEMLGALFWLVLAVPLATTTGVLTGALQGLSQFGRLNVISAGGTVLFQLLPLAAAALWSPSLAVVLPISLLARAVSLVALAIAVRAMLVRNLERAYSRERTVKLLKFGGWVTLSSFFAPLMSFVDRFAIGAVLGAASVAHYIVPLNLAERLNILGNSMGSALYPRFSAEERSAAVALAIKSEHILMAAMLLACTGAMFAIGPFLTLWVGREFAAAASTAGAILMLGIWFDSVSRVPLYALRGMNRPRVVAKVDAIQLFPYCFALYAGLHYAGLAGAACAYAFRVGLNYLLLEIEAGTLGSTIREAAAASALLIGSLLLALSLQPFSWQWLAAAASTLALAALFAFLVVPADLRQTLLESARGRVFGMRREA